MVGNKVLLNVCPLKGIMRFERRDKVSPTFIGLFEVLERVGEVAYRLALPPSIGSSSGITYFYAQEMDESLGYEEEPIVIVFRKVCKLRSKEISAVKVQWRGQSVKEAI
uniref:Uncharacterized protein LOC104237416 n=1 Tax=Nicotiana sylvestris TaxID=4096 RepID=A0A1U7XCS5_NICSY|nr:PREDICTED: uncharacterized protein LOC104237416 [Nicotiana sylvestris]